MKIPVSDVNVPPAADKHQDPKAILRAMLDGLSDEAVVLDAQGKIVMTNLAWQQYSLTFGPQPDPGTPTQAFSDLELASRGHSPHKHTSRAVQGIRDVLSGDIEAFSLTYPCHTPDAQVWFTMTVTPVLWEGDTGVLITHTDTTPRHRLAPR
ncbi:PAS domain-containing protein [Rhodoferax sp. U11-2br]|uniref:PAS domain-containing protein n=1 Tax=Rhodoferax sp. U11-2br TaxID=2838878 RepID=UPI001BED0C4D|nr:PAS domain-containing protein [Rhodoferax sp. U11-2br]MBT3066958.1 PAS domain-containing protein [Rhodoferax sp. U11-2br]